MGIDGETERQWDNTIFPSVSLSLHLSVPPSLHLSVFLFSVSELRLDALPHLSPSPVFALLEKFALRDRFFDAGALFIGRNGHWRARQVTVEPDHIHRGFQMPDAARRRHPGQSRQTLLQ